jgi:DNA polymerase I
MQRASLRAELSVSDAFCFDTETTGLDTHTCDIVALSFAFRKHEAYCVTLPSNRDEAKKILEEFREVFADENVMKIGQNMKYDLLVLDNYGIEVKGQLYDTMLAHYLIQPEQKHNLDHLVQCVPELRKADYRKPYRKKGKPADHAFGAG